MDHTVTWHEVECGSYAADLALWGELASAAAGPILELGCGAGRVALHLAELGHEVTGIDTDPTLVAELNSRAAAAEATARAVIADAMSFSLERSFPLALAPMQLVQLLDGRQGRRAMLDRVVAHLEPGGVLAAAVVEARSLPEPDADRAGDAPLPDVRERDRWVFSSLPRAMRLEGGRLEIERLRQAVSPTGEISEKVDITWLDDLSVEELADEARVAGLRFAGAREVPATHWHVGSTVCVMEAP